MIQLFGFNRNILGLFQDYDHLCKHIQTIENLKLLESHSRFLEEPWSFTFYSHKRLSYLYPKTVEKYFSKVGRQACEQELDLLEIYKGDYHNPIQMLVTESLDIDSLCKIWCHEYCDAHDLTLVDDVEYLGDPAYLALITKHSVSLRGANATKQSMYS